MTSNRFFPIIKKRPQFLIKGISSVKPLILRIYRIWGSYTATPSLKQNKKESTIIQACTHESTTRRNYKILLPLEKYVNSNEGEGGGLNVRFMSYFQGVTIIQNFGFNSYDPLAECFQKNKNLIVGFVINQCKASG